MNLQAYLLNNWDNSRDILQYTCLHHSECCSECFDGELMSVEDEMTEKLGIFDKSIIHTVYTCICHIYTTCSYLHLSGLIVKKIPQALKLFVFFFTILRYQIYYTCSFKSCIILFSSAKKQIGYCLRGWYSTALLLTLS